MQAGCELEVGTRKPKWDHAEGKAVGTGHTGSEWWSQPLSLPVFRESLFWPSAVTGTRASLVASRWHHESQKLGGHPVHPYF